MALLKTRSSRSHAAVKPIKASSLVNTKSKLHKSKSAARSSSQCMGTQSKAAKQPAVAAATRSSPASTYTRQNETTDEAALGSPSSVIEPSKKAAVATGGAVDAQTMNTRRSGGKRSAASKPQDTLSSTTQDKLSGEVALHAAPPLHVAMERKPSAATCPMVEPSEIGDSAPHSIEEEISQTHQEPSPLVSLVPIAEADGLYDRIDGSYMQSELYMHAYTDDLKQPAYATKDVVIDGNRSPFLSADAAKKLGKSREVLMLKNGFIGSSEAIDTDAPIRTRCQLAKECDRRCFTSSTFFEDDEQPPIKRMKAHNWATDGLVATSPSLSAKDVTSVTSVTSAVLKPLEEETLVVPTNSKGSEAATIPAESLEDKRNSVFASSNADEYFVLASEEMGLQVEPIKREVVDTAEATSTFLHTQHNPVISAHSYVKDAYNYADAEYNHAHLLSAPAVETKMQSGASIQYPDVPSLNRTSGEMNERANLKGSKIYEPYVNRDMYVKKSRKNEYDTLSQRDVQYKYPNVNVTNYEPAQPIPVLSLAEMSYNSHRLSLLPDMQLAKLLNIYLRYPTKELESKYSAAYQQFLLSVWRAEMQKEKSVEELRLEEQLFFEALKSQERGIHNLETAYLSVLSPYGRPVANFLGLFNFLDRKVTYDAVEVAKYRNVNSERLVLPPSNSLTLAELLIMKSDRKEPEAIANEPDVAYKAADESSYLHYDALSSEKLPNNSQALSTYDSTTLGLPVEAAHGFKDEFVANPSLGNAVCVEDSSQRMMVQAEENQLEARPAQETQLLEKSDTAHISSVPPTSTYSFSKGGASSHEYADLMATLERIPGVHYDKNNKMWLARIEDGSSPRHRRFSVSKFGFLEARKEAIATRNEYLQSKKHAPSTKDRAVVVRTTYGASPTFFNSRLVHKSRKAETLPTFTKKYPERQRKQVSFLSEDSAAAPVHDENDASGITINAMHTREDRHGIPKGFARFRGPFMKYSKNKFKRRSDRAVFMSQSMEEESAKLLPNYPNKYDPHFHSSFNPFMKIDEEFRLFSNSSVSAPTNSSQEWRSRFALKMQSDKEVHAEKNEALSGQRSDSIGLTQIQNRSNWEEAGILNSSNEAGILNSSNEAGILDSSNAAGILDSSNAAGGLVSSAKAYDSLSGASRVASTFRDACNEQCETNAAVSEEQQGFHESPSVLKTLEGSFELNHCADNTACNDVASPQQLQNAKGKRQVFLNALSELMASAPHEKETDGILSTRQMLRNLLSGYLANGGKARSPEDLRLDLLRGDQVKCQNAQILKVILQDKRMIPPA